MGDKLSEPKKKQKKIFDKPIGKEQFAQSYGVSRKTLLEWIKLAQTKGLKVKSHNGKVWKPWEANEIHKYLSLPPSSDLL